MLKIAKDLEAKMTEEEKADAEKILNHPMRIAFTTMLNTQRNLADQYEQEHTLKEGSEACLNKGPEFKY